MKNQKEASLAEFLTEAQLASAVQLFNKFGVNAVSQIQLIVIEPNLAAINTKLGQQNDGRYLAYAVVFALSQAAKALA